MTELQKLKKKADKVVSDFVRKKDSVDGIATCYTCGSKKEWKRMQCGHFVSRNNSATRYDLNNLRVQCAGCNVWGRGRYAAFADQPINGLGTRPLKELLEKGRSIYQLTIKELQEIIEKYAD